VGADGSGDPSKPNIIDGVVAKIGIRGSIKHVMGEVIKQGELET